MLFYLLNQIISSTVAFIYPTYASYKSLSRRPANEKDLEHWLMYWAVLGCIMVVEYTAEWAIAWFPLYYFIKLFFLLWLALPQTQGSTYLYNQVLLPFLTKSEPQIDAYLSDIKTNVYRLIRQAAAKLWEKIVAVVSQSTGVNLSAVDPSAASTTATANPNVSSRGNTSASQRLGPTGEITLGLWRAWGPSVLGALARVKELGQQPQAIQPQNSAPATTTSNVQNSAAMEARRRQLEAELAALNHQAPPPPPSSSHSSSSLNLAAGGLHQSVYLSDSSDHGTTDGRRTLRNRGRFEEIQKDEIDEGEGHSATEATPSAGWFGGWSRRASGYERVKSD